jgi:hypothetical protein
MKTCTKCKTEKSLDEFCSGGKYPWCGSCRKEYNEQRKKIVKEYYKNPEVQARVKEYNSKPEVKERQKQRSNVSKVKGYYKDYYSKSEVKERLKVYNSKPEVKEKQKEYHSRPEIKTRQKEYHSKPEIKARKKEYNKNKKIKNQSNKEYYTTYNSLPHVKERKYKQNAERRKNDIDYNLRNILRARFYSVVKLNNKQSSVLSLVGCTIEELRSFLEKQFLPEMTWENYGSIWEIDHILPCASFDLIKEEEQKKCFHYTNLQPLFKTTEIAESFGYKDYIGNRNKRHKII